MGSWLFGGNMSWRNDPHGTGETPWHSGILVLVFSLGLECSERHLSWSIIFTICPSEIIFVRILEKRMGQDHRAFGCSYLYWVNSRTCRITKEPLWIHIHLTEPLQWTLWHIFHSYSQEAVNLLALVPSHHGFALLLAFICDNFPSWNLFCCHELQCACNHVWVLFFDG